MERDSGLALSELRVDGGAAANDLLMQFQADMLGVPVVRPQVLETTALGAAYLAGLATGFWTSEDDIAANWRVDRRLRADDAARARRRAARGLGAGGGTGEDLASNARAARLRTRQSVHILPILRAHARVFERHSPCVHAVIPHGPASQHDAVPEIRTAAMPKRTPSDDSCAMPNAPSDVSRTRLLPPASAVAFAARRVH